MQSVVGVGTKMKLCCEFPMAEGAVVQQGTAVAVREQLASLVAQRRHAPSAARAVAEGTLVLVVDDHPTNRMVLKRQVNSLGYAAEAAADGKLAYEAWKTGRFNLIIADCNMPVMDGYELARAIRSDEQKLGLKRIPIVACTANAMATESAVCADAGMDDYMVKSCGLQQLAEQLARWAPIPSAPLQEAALIDHALLRTISMDDEAVQAEILADYGRTNEVDAAMLRRSAQDSDLPHVAHFAHRLKGACLMLGSVQLADVCASIEEAALSADKGAVLAGMDAFEFELQRVNDYLAELKRKAAPTEMRAPRISTTLA